MKNSREVEKFTGGTYVSKRWRPVPNWCSDHHSTSSVPRENCKSAFSSVCASRPVCVTLYSGFEWRSTPIGHASMVTVASVRSEEHTSELQSLRHLVCRLLL